MGEGSFDEAVSGIANLSDPLRRALYRFVAGQDQAVSRDQAAAALGISRAVAATNLDRLAEGGLLDIEFRRLGARQGPGAGRPSKLYRRGVQDLAISLPERRYDLAADLLASAVCQAGELGSPVDVALDRVARDRGGALGRSVGQRAGPGAGRGALVRAATEILADHGYEPRARSGEIVLSNCPFHRLAAKHTALVCAMNHSLLAGMADAAPEVGMTARLEPAPGWCCVRLDLSRPDSTGLDPTPE
jgi:predicted ArsR family transcriptional regulator